MAAKKALKPAKKNTKLNAKKIKGEKIGSMASIKYGLKFN